jgi:hypothetical protein
MVFPGYPTHMRQRHKALLELVRNRLEGFEMRQLIRETRRQNLRLPRPVPLWIKTRNGLLFPEGYDL